MVEFGVYKIQFGKLPSKTHKGIYLRPVGGNDVYVVEQEDGTAIGKAVPFHNLQAGESIKPVDLNAVGGGKLYVRIDTRFSGELERFKGDYKEEHGGITLFWLKDPDRLVGCVRLCEREDIQVLPLSGSNAGT
jgi:hypothetical protein